MKLASKGTGTIYDKFGSHHLDEQRRWGEATGFRMSTHPGKTMVCCVCNTRKPTKSGSTSSSRFTCGDCLAVLRGAK